MKKPTFQRALFAVTLAASLLTAGSALGSDDSADALIKRGQYLVTIGGCNDCHTPGYMQIDGKLPTGEWLTGNSMGFSGPWGTTYPANLRLLLQSMNESQWIATARSPKRPPMPWFNLSQMSDEDLRAVYAFVRSLGAKGEPAPAFTPPGEKVGTPFIEFVPKNLPQQHAMK